MYGCSKDCLRLTPFRMPQISYFTLSFKCFSSKTIAPLWESDPCFSHPTHCGQVQSYTHSPFSLTSFILPNFLRFYIFFSADQVLLSVLSWYSASTSVSEGVLLMYPWREMYSMSTYSSTILFSSLNFLRIFYQGIPHFHSAPNTINYLPCFVVKTSNSNNKKCTFHGNFKCDLYISSMILSNRNNN